jgi:hypothetical protein
LLLLLILGIKKQACHPFIVERWFAVWGIASQLRRKLVL